MSLFLLSFFFSLCDCARKNNIPAKGPGCQEVWFHLSHSSQRWSSVGKSPREAATCCHHHHQQGSLSLSPIPSPSPWCEWTATFKTARIKLLSAYKARSGLFCSHSYGGPFFLWQVENINFSLLAISPFSACWGFSSRRIHYCAVSEEGVTEKMGGNCTRLQAKRASLVTQQSKIHLQCRCGFSPWVKKIPQKRKWQPTPVFLPGKPHGQRNLVGYSP